MAETGCSLAADPWLGAVLDRDVYRLAMDDASSLPDDPAALARTLSARPGFTYTRVRTGDVAGIRLLQAAGLHLVDTSVVLEKPIHHSRRIESNSRLATPEDRSGIRRIARGGFEFSRFHLDPCIPNELANRVKEEWVESYFSGRRGDAMVVSSADGAAAGFLALLVDRTDDTLVIDLIAVDPRYRKRGLAGDMIMFGESWFVKAPRIRVGTQLANVPSLRMYEKLGFRIVDSSYVFHHHSIAS